MNTNFQVIDLTRLGIKPESTAQETDALYHSAIRAVKKIAANGYLPSIAISPGINLILYGFFNAHKELACGFSRKYFASARAVIYFIVC